MFELFVKMVAPLLQEKQQPRAFARNQSKEKALAPTLVVDQLLFLEGRAPVCTDMAKSLRVAEQIGPIGAC